MITSAHNDRLVVFQRLARVVRLRKSCQLKLTMGTYRPFVLLIISSMKWLRLFERVDLDI